MKKNLLKNILIGIPFCILVLFPLGKSAQAKPEQPQTPAAVVNKAPAVQTQSPVQKNTEPKDGAQYIKDDINAILDTYKMFVQQGDFGKTLTNIGDVLALNNNPDPQKNKLAKFVKNGLSFAATGICTFVFTSLNI